MAFQDLCFSCFLSLEGLTACLPVRLPALGKGEGRAGRAPSVSAAVISRVLSPLDRGYPIFALSLRLPPSRITTCLVADRLRVGACTRLHDPTKAKKNPCFRGVGDD